MTCRTCLSSSQQRCFKRFPEYGRLLLNALWGHIDMSDLVWLRRAARKFRDGTDSASVRTCVGIIDAAPCALLPPAWNDRGFRSPQRSSSPHFCVTNSQQGVPPWSPRGFSSFFRRTRRILSAAYAARRIRIEFCHFDIFVMRFDLRPINRALISSS